MGKRAKKDVNTDLDIAVAEKVAEKVESVPLATCAYPKCKTKFFDDLYAPYCSATCRIFHVKSKSARQKHHKYKPEYASTKLYEYIKYCEESHYMRMRSTGNQKVAIPVSDPKLPSERGYATFIGVSHPTLARWEKESKAFGEAMKLLGQIQYDWLVSNGVAGKYNSKVAALVLMSEHNMVERQKADHSHTLGVVRSVYERADELGVEYQELPHHDDQD